MANVNVEISAQIDKFQKNLDEAQASLKSFGASIQRLAIPAAAVSLAISAIGVSAVRTFAELEGVKTAFDRLDNPRLLDNLRKATKGTTSDFELMKNAVQASNFKIPVEQLASLMEFASRRAKDTGESVDYLVNSIVTGIGRKSPLILDNLGISATELREQLGGVSMEAASIADVSEAVGRIASAELKKMGKDSDTLAEQFLRIKTIFTNEMGGMGETISKALSPAVNAIENLALKFQALSPEMKNMIVYIGAGIAAFAGLVAAAGAIITIAPLVAAAWTAIGGPIALVATGVAVAAGLIISNWDKVKIAIMEGAAFILNKVADLVLKMSQLASRLGLDTIANKLADATWNLKDRADGLTTSVRNARNAIEVLAEVEKNAEINARLAALAQERLASGLNSVASGAARARIELKLLNDAIIAINGEEFDPKPVQEKNLRTLDRGVTIPIGMPNIQGIIPQVKADAQTLAGEFNDTLSGTLTQGLNTVIVDIASGIGEALASGGNLIDSLGAVFLGSMGGILKQLGEMAIQVGIGVLAVKKALQTLNPFVAIAAGVALVAIGSAFSSSARSLGGSMGGQGSQGSQTFTSGSVVDPAQYSEPKWEVMERNGDLMARISYGTNRRGR